MFAKNNRYRLKKSSRFFISNVIENVIYRLYLIKSQHNSLCWLLYSMWLCIFRHFLPPKLSYTGCFWSFNSCMPLYPSFVDVLPDLRTGSWLNNQLRSRISGDKGITMSVLVSVGHGCCCSGISRNVSGYSADSFFRRDSLRCIA